MTNCGLLIVEIILLTFREPQFVLKTNIWSFRKRPFNTSFTVVNFFPVEPELSCHNMEQIKMFNLPKCQDEMNRVQTSYDSERCR